MNRWRLLLRGLAYYWRTNLAVVAGVAIAVAVLSGALVVGASVKRSLRDLALKRLGHATHQVTSTRFFRERLADDLLQAPGLAGPGVEACPLMVLEGLVTHQGSGRRASRVRIYGVDDRFWRFHALSATEGPRDRDAFLSLALARELASAEGDTLLLRLEKPEDVPGALLFGRREDRGVTVRVRASRTLGPWQLGEFTTRPRQGDVLALFAPLALLQRELGQESRANVVLLAHSGEDAAGRASLAAAMGSAYRLEDVGLRLRPLWRRGALSLESDSGLVADAVALSAEAVASRLGWRTSPVLTYLANAIRADDREVPYSLVTAVDSVTFSALGGTPSGESILVNRWAAEDLAAPPGASVTLEYYVWEEEGRLRTRTADFWLAGVVPLEGAAADPDLAPRYPGITDSPSLSDWEPPFPLDLGKVRPRDEEYWKQFRTTPKAFVPLARGQELWGHRLGNRTSIRMHPARSEDLEAAQREGEAALRASLDPLTLGFTVEASRAEALAAAQGSGDFGQYFLAFSSFLMAAALLLAALFFRLGVEQRSRELGVLRALGFGQRDLRRLLLAEGVALALLGSAVGLAACGAYAALLMHGLRTWWVDAVGTRDLALHVSAPPLAAGAIAGMLTAVLCIAATLRGLGRRSPRRLLAGAVEALLEPSIAPGRGPRRLWHRLVLTGGLLSVVLAIGAARGWWADEAGFFGSGTVLLLASFCFLWAWLSAPRRRGLVAAVPALGFRSATSRPGRSLLCIALIAGATFVIVAVGAFRRSGAEESKDRASGTGGYALLAESQLPLHHDLATPDGREALNLVGPEASAVEAASFARFRLRPGDDASCLNLYRPQSPRILGATPQFLAEGRFRFQQTLAIAPETEANPWRLLEQELPDGAVPVIGDANSLTYVLHLRVGDHLVLERPHGRPLRLQVVAALADSLFQGELIMSEALFLRAFPDQEGYRVFLVDAPPERAAAVSQLLESRLGDFGFDAVPAAEYLAGFHRVENTYLATFQALGGLGLVLGTLGLAAVLLRNALERRQELALLRAVGFASRHLATLVVAENALLLGLGLLTGAGCALVAVLPVVMARGGSFPAGSLAALLLALAATGALVSVLGVAAARKGALLAALRAE